MMITPPAATSLAASVGGGLAALWLLRKWRENSWPLCENTKRLDGKVAVITGATSGLGRVLAVLLAELGATVVLACRSVTEGKNVAAEIQSANPRANIDVVELDLASFDSVRSCAAELLAKYPQIHILVNNAGVSVPQNIKTMDGFEVNMGVNHLGHFLLTNLLLQRIKESAPSRIVIISSMLHERGVIEWDNFDGSKPISNKGRHNAGYCNSKLANALFGTHLAKLLEGTGVNVYTVCPGWNYTKLFRHSSFPWYSWLFVLPVAFWYMRPARIGVQTILHCITNPASDEESGLFYRDCKPYTSKADLSAETAQKLWDVSVQLCKL